MSDEAGREARGVVADTAAAIGENLTSLFGDVEPSRIFETLQESDDRVVIGASSIERAGGFGFGGGEGAGTDGETGSGGGGGGGGAGQARPVAVIEITAAGVKVWPVIDYTKLGLVAVGVLAAMWKARR